MVENGEAGGEMADKPTRSGRKHSLPQQLDTAGVRQVGIEPCWCYVTGVVGGEGWFGSWFGSCEGFVNVSFGVWVRKRGGDEERRFWEWLG